MNVMFGGKKVKLFRRNNGACMAERSSTLVHRDPSSSECCQQQSVGSYLGLETYDALGLHLEK